MVRISAVGAAGIVFWLALVPLPFGSTALAADEDCVERGGKATCSNMEIRPQQASLCYEAGDTAPRYFAACHQWGAFDCGPSKVTPFNTKELAENYASELFRCGPPTTNQVTGWLAAGQTLGSGGCYGSSVTPTYQNGVETANYAQYLMSGVADDPYTSAACDSTYSGERVTARRYRQLLCPQGYAQRSVVYGVYECYRLEEQDCPCCGNSDGTACKVGNPVSTGYGKKTLVETDYEAGGALNRPGFRRHLPSHT